MKQSQRTYPVRQVVSSLFMVVTLLWLTVSSPFVYDAQQSLKKEAQKESRQTSNNTNPFANTTEEKSGSSVNTLSEYLHEATGIEKNFVSLVRLYKTYPSNIYYEYNPELLSPPPEA